MTATSVPLEGDASSPKSSRAPKKRKKGILGTLLTLLFLLLGVAVILYPVISTQYNNYKQREFAQQYNNTVANADPNRVNKELEAARKYNEALDGIPILDPYLTKITVDKTAPYMQYLEQLNATEAMARVRVPSGDIDLPVYHGTADSTIAKGAGHLYGTSLPVGGDSSHAVVTSHTGMANATLFDGLIKVKKGDLLFIDVYGKTLTYEVDQIKVVLPTEIEDLKQVKGKDLLTLFTCTPYAVNTHRLLVTGHRVPTPPGAEPAGNPVWSVFDLLPWMWPLVIIGALGLLLFLFIFLHDLLGIGKRRKPKRAVAEKENGVGEVTPAEDGTQPPPLV